jgi:hypothetical protein
MMRKLFISCAALLALFIFLNSCDSLEAADGQTEYVGISAASYPVDNPEGNICILVYNTEYKMKLLGELVDELNSKRISITVDDMAEHGSYDPAGFDAVVLLSGIQGFTPLSGAVDYINAHDYRENIVYYSGYTLFKVPYGFKLKKKRIDAITAASKLEEPKHLQIYQDTKAAIIAAVMERL